MHLSLNQAIFSINFIKFLLIAMIGVFRIEPGRIWVNFKWTRRIYGKPDCRPDQSGLLIFLPFLETQTAAQKQTGWQTGFQTGPSGLPQAKSPFGTNETEDPMPDRIWDRIRSGVDLACFWRVIWPVQWVFGSVWLVLVWFYPILIGLSVFWVNPLQKTLLKSD